MSIRTTCIGAYPKPAHIDLANWSEADTEQSADASARVFDYSLRQTTSLTDDDFDRATRDAVLDQVACGIDIPTDGEQRRANYIHYHCSHLDGIDFDKLTQKVHRAGAAIAVLPTISAKVAPKGSHFLARDFIVAQKCTSKPVKITVPGPVTIIDTTANAYYETERQLGLDLADALNVEIRALADAGCRYIQVDEPLFARKVDDALDFGIECLERCFYGLPKEVSRVMHMCCGYPGHLDDKDYLKADPGSYARLAAALDEASVDQISIEDAHRHNDLALLERFSNSTIILGGIAIAASRIEGVDEIAERLSGALNHIDRERLIAAPDCGLIMFDRKLAMVKLRNLCAAARLV